MVSRKKAAGTAKKKTAARSHAARSSRTKATARSARPKRRRATATSAPAYTRRSVPFPLTDVAGIGVTHHHVEFSSHDLEAMMRFYAQSLGFTRLRMDSASGQVTLRTTPTSSLGFGPPASTAPDQWQPPGEPNLYFFVSDVDAVFAKLSAEGVLFDQAPTDMPGGQRLAVLRDPEGRRVCLAQNLER